MAQCDDAVMTMTSRSVSPRAIRPSHSIARVCHPRHGPPMRPLRMPVMATALSSKRKIPAVRIAPRRKA